MKRIVAVSVILGITNLPISCIDPNRCGSFAVYETSISKLTSSVGSFELVFETSNSDQVDKAAIKIAISELNYMEVSELNHSFSILPSLHACSPPEPTPSQALEAISIKSKSSIFANGREFLAGENLSELFKITDHTFSSSEETLTLAEFIIRQQNDPWVFGIQGSEMIFQLINQPDMTIDQTLTFEFQFSDDTSLAIQTASFKVES